MSVSTNSIRSSYAEVNIYPKPELIYSLTAAEKDARETAGEKSTTENPAASMRQGSQFLLLFGDWI